MTAVPGTGTPVTTPRWWSSSEERPEEVTEPAGPFPDRTIGKGPRSRSGPSWAGRILGPVVYE